ncbi:MAG: HD domain-containing protein [Erysipelotrichaceae bacterium]|nr:HD domain-containing protein [Erysipelotrichaceae bacterium]
MRETRIMKVFEQYIKKFDMNKGNVKAIYFHSLKMMELCKDIATNLGIFNEEEIIVCGLIGLFHDIGMISNKFKNCLTLEDNTDKSKESLDILFEKEKLIRNITENKKYDDIIKIAIYCQNKNGLPQGFDTKVLHFCMIVKDAHVIENFRMVTNYPYMDMHIDNFPNDLVYSDFKKYRVINSKVSDNDADKILEVMSLIFGVYYTYSYTLIKEEACVNKLVQALKISNKNISKFFYQIGSVLNVYIDRKIGG